MELASEFAKVQVERDDSGNGPRLMIRDVTTGRTVFLDPLELETLAWLEHGELSMFMDPSYKRWRGREQSDLDRLLGGSLPQWGNDK